MLFHWGGKEGSTLGAMDIRIQRIQRIGTDFFEKIRTNPLNPLNPYIHCPTKWNPPMKHPDWYGFFLLFVGFLSIMHSKKYIFARLFSGRDVLSLSQSYQRFIYNGSDSN
ncbi:MAG: hypothetical protein RL329_3909 [Bacteroidota bacterium]